VLGRRVYQLSEAHPTGLKFQDHRLQDHPWTLIDLSMVTTQAGSSASPPDRAGSPPALPDGTGTQAVLPDRVATPPLPSSMFGNFTAPTESNILAHVLTDVLKQPGDSPLVRALDEAGINEINDLLTLDHHLRNALTYERDDGTVKPLPIGYKNLLRVLKIFVDFC